MFMLKIESAACVGAQEA